MFSFFVFLFCFYLLVFGMKLVQSIYNFMAFQLSLNASQTDLRDLVLNLCVSCVCNSVAPEGSFLQNRSIRPLV